MIEQPPDIIHHIIGEELGKGHGVIDTIETNGQTGLTKARANHLGWKMAFTVNKNINSKKLIEGIAKETKLFPFFKGDKLSFNSIQDSYDSADFEIKRDDIISLKFDRTKIEDVKTKVVLHYHYDYATDEYPKTTLNNGEADTAEEFFITNGYQNSYLGIKGEQGDDPIEVKYIRHEEGVADSDQTISKLQRFLLSWYCNQHNTCSIRLPLRYLYAEVGDIIAFDKEVNDNLLYGEGYSLYYRNNVSVTIRNGQEILPYFLCTEVKKSLEYVDLKLIQLHSQDDEITNVAPIANAGADQSGYYGDTITLDGTGSSDPDGDELNYIWTNDVGTQLDDLDTATPSFPIATYTDTIITFTLVVNDGEFNSLPDTCIVHLNPAGLSLSIPRVVEAPSQHYQHGYHHTPFIGHDWFWDWMNSHWLYGVNYDGFGKFNSNYRLQHEWKATWVEGGGAIVFTGNTEQNELKYRFTDITGNWIGIRDVNGDLIPEGDVITDGRIIVTIERGGSLFKWGRFQFYTNDVEFPPIRILQYGYSTEQTPWGLPVDKISIGEAIAEEEADVS